MQDLKVVDMRKINLFDRLLMYFNPQAAFNRISWREYTRSMYDSGSYGRLNSGWQAVNSPAEMTNQAERDNIRARARDLERNANIAEAIISAHERNIIGTGLTLQSKVTDENGNEIDVINEKHEKLFKKWCSKEHCDVTGQQSFKELQTMAVRRIKVDGGILFLKVYDKNAFFPFKLQAREVDDIDSSIYQSGGNGKNRIINGIELDEYNKPIAYYIRNTAPNGLYMSRGVRVPAENVIFLFRKKRPSQIREISELATTAGEVKNVNEFVEAISVKERILACFSIFIKRQNAPSHIGRGSQVQNENIEKEQTIAPGIINYLAPGDDITVANPNGQSANAKEFIMLNQRLAASGQGLSYESVSRDLSQVNYSSARQGLLEDRVTYNCFQAFIIENFLNVVYEEFITSLYLNNTFNYSDFEENKDKYIAHEWITPARSWIDPQKEVNANKIALETNQITLSELAAQNGKDWQDLLRQRAKETNFINKTIKGKNQNASKTFT